MLNTTLSKKSIRKKLERGGVVHGAAWVRSGLGTGRGPALP